MDTQQVRSVTARVAVDDNFSRSSAPRTVFAKPDEMLLGRVGLSQNAAHRVACNQQFLVRRNDPGMQF